MKNQKLSLLYSIFALSGFCGLIYESVWTHYLKLFLGHAAYAQSVVLVTFIGGLALGAWLISKFAARIRNPILFYAIAEAVIGIVALLFHVIYIAITNWSYTTLLPATCSAENICYTQWLISIFLILPQSMLLGTTFPLMSTGVLRLAPDLPGHKISLLYFLNSFGAVIGVLASAFILIPNVGLPGTLLTAGLLNILLAIIIYPVSKHEQQPLAISGKTFSSTNPITLSKEYKLLLIIAALTGLSSFVYEIVWIRMLTLVFGASTHAFEIMLASFILGLALGSLWIRKRIDRIPDTVKFLAIVQIIMGIAAILTLPLYNYSFDAMAWLIQSLARNNNGYILFNLSITVIALAIMLPATFCAGMTLPLITYRLLNLGIGEKSIGQVYAVNTLGSILGVLIAIHFALPILGLKSTLIFGGAIDIGLGIILFTATGLILLRTASREKTIWVSLGVFTLVISLLVFQLDPLKVASGVFRKGQARLPADTKVLKHYDGKTATVNLLEYSSGATVVTTNGKADGGIHLASDQPAADEVTMILTGVIPLSFIPDAQDVAVIGFGTGLTTTTLLGSPALKKLETIEIEPKMIEAAKGFQPVVNAAFSDPRSKIIIEDAKSYFSRGNKKYDLIISEPSNPWVSGVSSLFTEEFYQRVQNYLTDRGILAQWIQMYEIGPEIIASIVEALDKTFPYYVIYEANFGDLIIVASKNPLTSNKPEKVFSMPEVVKMLDRIKIKHQDQLQIRKIGSQKTITSFLKQYNASANSDYFPLVDNEAPKHRFMGKSGNALFTPRQLIVPLTEVLEQELPAHIPYIEKAQSYSVIEEETAQARSILHYLLKEPSLQPLPSDLQQYKAESIIFKLYFIECQRFTSTDSVWPIALTIASQVNKLSPADVNILWQRLRLSKCYKTLSPTQQDWISLFHTVGQRNYIQVAELSQKLSQTPNLSIEERHYLILSGTTAYLALNRPEFAKTYFQLLTQGMPLTHKESLAWYPFVEAITSTTSATK